MFVTKQKSWAFKALTTVAVAAFAIGMSGCTMVNPISPTVQAFDAAKALLNQGEFAGAAKAFGEFLKANPNTELTAAAMFYQANSLAQGGKTAEAQAAYAKLINTVKSGVWAESAKYELETMGR